MHTSNPAINHLFAFTYQAHWKQNKMEAGFCWCIKSPGIMNNFPVSEHCAGSQKPSRVHARRGFAKSMAPAPHICSFQYNQIDCYWSLHLHEDYICNIEHHYTFKSFQHNNHFEIDFYFDQKMQNYKPNDLSCSPAWEKDWKTLFKSIFSVVGHVSVVPNIFFRPFFGSLI